MNPRMLSWHPGSGSGAARPPVSVAPAHSWRRARGAGLGAAGGRGTGAGGGSSWPLARGLGDAGLTSGLKAAGEAGAKAGWKRGPEGVSSAGGGGPCCPRAGQGSLATERRCGGTDTSPISLPPPGNGAGSARGSAGETPPSDSSPGGTPAAGTGRGGVPSKTDLASAPAAQAPPSQHLILKGAVPL